MAHCFYPIRLKLVWQRYLAALTSVITAQESGMSADPSRLYQYPDCEYIESKWNDGDSFLLRLTDGQTITARLYEVDTIETQINNNTAARRLRAQRRYFGIFCLWCNSRGINPKGHRVGRTRDSFYPECTRW